MFMFRTKLDARTARRLFAVSIRARGLSLRHGVRQTVRVPVLTLAQLSAEARS